MKRVRQRSRLHMPVDPAVLAYAAGLVDGEGSITIRQARTKHSPMTLYHNIQLTIGVTEPTLILWLSQQFGGLTSVRRRGRANWKALHDWYLCGQQVAVFLRGVWPYLIIKRGQAEVALAFCQTSLGPRRSLRGYKLPVAVSMQREQFRLRMRGLNKRGLSLVASVGG